LIPISLTTLHERFRFGVTGISAHHQIYTVSERERLNHLRALKRRFAGCHYADGERRDVQHLLNGIDFELRDAININLASNS
jgi:hypothetical protein